MAISELVMQFAKVIQVPNSFILPRSFTQDFHSLPLPSPFTPDFQFTIPLVCQNKDITLQFLHPARVIYTSLLYSAKVIYTRLSIYHSFTLPRLFALHFFILTRSFTQDYQSPIPSLCQGQLH